MSYEYENTEFETKAVNSKRKMDLKIVACLVFNENYHIHRLVNYYYILLGHRMKSTCLENFVRDLFRFRRW